MGEVDFVTERLAVWNATLGDANGTVVPSRLIQKHTMVMERTGSVKVIGRMDDEGIVHANGYRRRARGLHKNGEEEQERKIKDRRPSTVDANCTSWHT